jgi:hypothetical protein
MSRNVSVNSGPLKYGQNISVGPHAFHSDEPSEYGGHGEGPTAIDCSWPHWGHVPVSQLKCMPKGDRGLFGKFMSTCHRPESRPRIMVSPTRILRWLTELIWGFPWLGTCPTSNKGRPFDVVQRCHVHRMLVSQVQIYPKLLVPTGQVEMKPGS